MSYIDKLNISGTAYEISALSAKNSEKLGGQASSYYATSAVSAAISAKQDKLTAISPIVISDDNRISNNGNDCVVNGTNAWAEGNNTLANGYASHAEGNCTTADGYQAHAEGSNTSAGQNSHAEGCDSIADNYSHAEGFGTSAIGWESHAEGYSTVAYGSYSHAAGNYSTAAGDAAYAEGNYVKALGNHSHAEGDNTSALNVAAHAEGYGTSANGYNSHAEGISTKTNAAGAHAEGNNTSAFESYSHAEGNETLASNNQAHAEGDWTTACGYASHSEGNRTSAVGNSTHAEGSGTSAIGDYSHSEGYNNIVNSSASHVEGYNNIADGFASHIEGTNNVANGEAAHIEGENNIADDLCDHVEGMGGIASHGGMMHIEGFQYHNYMGNGPAADYYGNNVVRFYNMMNFGVKDVSINGSLYELVKAFKEKFLVSCEYSSQSEYHYTGNTFYDPKLYKILDVNLNNGFIEITIDGTIDCQSGGSILLYGPTSLVSITESGGSLSSNQKLKQYTFYSLGFPGNNLKTVTPENTFISINYYYTRAGSSEENYYKILKISSIEQAYNGYLITTDEEIEIPEILGGGYTINLYRISPSNYGNNHIEGSDNTIRFCSNSHIEGSTNLITSNYSHAEGYYTTAKGEASHVEGYGSVTNYQYSHAEGYYTTTDGEAAHAEGKNVAAYGIAAHAEGYNTRADGNYTHAEGYYTTASHVGTHAEGNSTRATMYQAHAEGYNTSATMDHAHAEGEGTLACGRDAHAEGWGTSATAPNTHSEGYYSRATNNEAHAEGNYTSAVGFASHAEGQNCLATTTAAHAEGYNTNSYGQGSHSEGYLTTATNEAAHVEGKNVAAHGTASHAEGLYTTAYSIGSHVEGYKTTTQILHQNYEIESAQNWDENAFIDTHKSEGWQNFDFSNVIYHEAPQGHPGYWDGYVIMSISANYSHAEGSGTSAFGAAAHAAGIGTKTYDEAGTVIGKYNSNNTGAFIIGNGTDDNNRSDALTVDWEGNVNINNTNLTGGDHWIGIASKNADGVSNKIHLENNRGDQRGVYLSQSNGQNGKWAFVADKNNMVTFNGNLNGLASTANCVQDYGNTAQSIYIGFAGAGVTKVEPEAGNTSAGTRYLIAAFKDSSNVTHYKDVNVSAVTVNSAVSANNANNLGGKAASTYLTAHQSLANYAKTTGTYTASSGMKVYSAVKAANLTTVSSISWSTGSKAIATGGTTVTTFQVPAGRTIDVTLSFMGNSSAEGSAPVTCDLTTATSTLQQAQQVYSGPGTGWHGYSYRASYKNTGTAAVTANLRVSGHSSIGTTKERWINFAARGILI